MPKDTINITIDRDLWNSLAQNAHEQSLCGGERFPTIKALRWAIKVFIRLEAIEIDEILMREPYHYPPYRV
jgi:hypothetical protein